ncbi:pre-mRNA-splicing factor Cwc26p [[Candida] jaroonii]|uniref:Pre-mRNA-splicing factor Cwc26p n=1 Tax=[Candida] jaroonii TaxID=467808 RepID=A0ACA9YFM3_9ASCO|nr:pre-mRNA-splicing factor Cwc26p [[Candida] jaroonii]
MKDLSNYSSKKKKSKKKSNLVVDEAKIEDGGEFIDKISVVEKAKVKTIDKVQKPQVGDANPSQTVYRDLTGRIIDINKVKVPEKNKVVINIESEIQAPKSFTVSEKDEEYQKYRKNTNLIDDPLRSNNTTRPLDYNKGVNLPNRFGIKAGILWDGIDRSNGFEILALRSQNETKSKKKVVEDYELDYDI